MDSEKKAQLVKIAVGVAAVGFFSYVFYKFLHAKQPATLKKDPFKEIIDQRANQEEKVR